VPATKKYSRQAAAGLPCESTCGTSASGVVPAACSGPDVRRVMLKTAEKIVFMRFFRRIG
jgi:hypothetical protein